MASGCTNASSEGLSSPPCPDGSRPRPPNRSCPMSPPSQKPSCDAVALCATSVAPALLQRPQVRGQQSCRSACPATPKPGHMYEHEVLGILQVAGTKRHRQHVKEQGLHR
eukprot:8377694-Pyramimonas_sp.AAC.1